MAELVLSQRLQALAHMVTPGRRVVDVGCDHGFVSIYLVQKGISPGVLAMDVRRGPLSRAQEHIGEAGLGAYIETRLSDGLLEYREGEADSLICAGMGGRLMRKILTESRDKARSLQELILQPQSELQMFRSFLRDEGYCLLDENIIWEEGKYYFLMKVRYGGEDAVAAAGAAAGNADGGAKPQKKDAAAEIDWQLADKYGMLLLQRRSPLLRQYLEDSLQSMRQIEALIKASVKNQNLLAGKEKERARERLKEVQQEIMDLERALGFYADISLLCARAEQE